uniref:Mediator of RNA polymerase II transcription subunit 23 n=1 Tax=Pavo cristatus TaxID=9049 RepID=A0A8C9FS63_PAVCR
MVPMETQLQSIFEEVVKTEVIEEAFPGMFMDTPEDERTKLISCLGAFRQFWSSLSQVNISFVASLYFICFQGAVEGKMGG